MGVSFKAANVIFESVMLGALLPECHYIFKSSDQQNGSCLCMFSVSAINLATINKFLQDHCWFIFFFVNCLFFSFYVNKAGVLAC